MSTKALALLACLMPVAANAIPLTFIGTTVAADGSLGIAIGDAFEATVDFDLSSPTASSGVNFTDYEIGGAALVSAGGYSSAGSIAHINVANDYAFQRYDAWAAIGTVGAGLPLLLVLKDPDGTAFDSTTLFLPTSRSAYEEAFWSVGAARGTLESVFRTVSVPEPSTMLLLSSALLGFGVLRRARPV